MKIGRGYVATKDQKVALAKMAGLAERDVRSADIPGEVITNLRFRKDEGVHSLLLEPAHHHVSQSSVSS